MQPKELARLLSGRNEPSVLEKEAAFATLSRLLVSPRSRQRTLAAVLGGILSLSGAAAAIAFFLPLASHPPDNEEFATRGPTDRSPALRLACIAADTSEVPCRVGGTLTFEVSKVPETARFFAAFARRPDGAVLWYFPEPAGRSMELKPTPHLLSQAVRLGAPHVPGDYEVFAVFSSEPMTRAEIKAALGTNLTPTGPVVLVKRRLSLQDAP